MEPFSGQGILEAKKYGYEPATVSKQIGSRDNIVLREAESLIEESCNEGVYPVPDLVSVDYFKFLWNTKDNGSGAVALVNSQAKWREGKWYLKLEERDITAQIKAHYDSLILDNFRPYVEKVAIGSPPWYEAQWVLSGTTLNLRTLTNRPLKAGSYPVTVTFSEPMCNAPTLSVGELDALSLGSSEPQDKRIHWSGTLIIPADGSILDGEQIITINGYDIVGNQICAVSQGATSISPASKLHRLASGSMPASGGLDEVHTVMINRRTFSVRCTPPSSVIKEEESKTYTVLVQNCDPDSIGVYTLSIEGSGGGWGVSLPSPEQLVIGRNDSATAQFSVRNISATEALYITVTVQHTQSGVVKVPESLAKSRVAAYIDDHPDDNMSVASGQYPSLWLYDSKSAVGVLSNGWGEGLHYLLGKFNVATALVKPDLTILNEPGRTIEDLRVLLAGSAGLDGLESSPMFRQKIAEFVSNGGVLITLTAKNGYEFASLPGGAVAGYGWNEDQSCLNAAVSMVKYHQVLSGQRQVNLSANVDGYYTKWPANATVLLQRNKNGMPALLMYPFGAGMVITTTIFEDWAYGHNQSTESGQRLIRDMVAWSRLAKPLPEFAVGTDVAVAMNIINTTGSDAEKAVITAYCPDRHAVKTDTISLTVASLDTVTAVYALGTAPDTIGIWYVYYSLLTSAHEIIQEAALGELFVISDPAGVAATPDITFAVNSDAEYYAHGSDGVFTITVWNHSGSNRTVYAWWSFPRNFWERHEDIYGNPGTAIPWHNSNLHDTLFLLPNNSSTITYTAPIYATDILCVQFADENDKFLGSATRGFFHYTPSCRVILATDKKEYLAGDSVALNLSLEHKQPVVCTVTTTITILNPDNINIWEYTFNQHLEPYEHVKKDTFFIMPSACLTGGYTIRTETLCKGNRAGSWYTSFTVPEPLFIITPMVSGVVHEGNNPVSFIIDNNNLSGETTAVLEARLLSPSGTVVWNETREFYAEPGNSARVDCIIPLNTIELGKYRIGYRILYQAVYTKEAYKNMISSCVVTAAADKDIYTARESVFLDVNIVNTGIFQYDTLICSVMIPGISADRDTTALDPGRAVSIPFSLQIPDTVSAGLHIGTVTLTVPSGSTMSTQCYVTIPESKMVLYLDTVNYTAGDQIVITAENRGGTDVSVQCVLQLHDATGWCTAQQEYTLALRSGENAFPSITIPDQAVTGSYAFTAYAYDSSNSDSAALRKILTVTGLSAALNVYTGKPLYQSDDTARATAEITVHSGSIEQGRLELTAAKEADAWITFTSTAWDTMIDHGVQAIAAHHYNTVTLNRDGTVEGWGDNGCSQNDIPAGLSGVTAIASGEAFTIALHDDATVSAWGDNGCGQTDVPAGLMGVSAIAAGLWHAAALKENGTVTAWGCNGHGETEVPLWLSGVTALAAGQEFTAALKDNGTVVVWGNNDYGQTEVPADLGPVKAIAAGGAHLIALKEDGTVFSWGNNAYGQTSVPAGLSGVKAVAAGSYHSLAVKQDGSVIAWGYNSDGQTDIPAGLSDVTAVAGGFSHTVALKADGSVVAWGNNNYGQTDITVSPQCTFLRMNGDIGSHEAMYWKTIQWSTATLPDTAVRLFTRSANTLQALATASWSDAYTVSGDAVSSSPGRYIEIQASRTNADSSTIPPALDSIAVRYTTLTPVWQQHDTISVTQTQSYSYGLLMNSDTGTYSLQGCIQSRAGQTIARSAYQFLVSNTPLQFSFQTDQSTYNLYDTVTVYSQAVNAGSQPFTDIPLRFICNATVVFEQIIDLAPGQSRTDTFSMPALSEIMLLTGILQEKEISRRITAAAAHLDVLVNCPDIVGRDSFTVSVALINQHAAAVQTTVSIDDSLHSRTIPGLHSETVEQQLCITEDMILTVQVSGDFNRTIRRYITFGEQAVITMLPQPLYPEGVVSIPYTVENRGMLDCRVPLTFTIGETSIEKQLFIPSGATINEVICCNQNTGAYTVTYRAWCDSGSAYYRVVPLEHILVQVEADIAAPKILILRDYQTDTAFASILASAGMDITLSSHIFSDWNGTNPSVEGFTAVMLPCGNYFWNAMSVQGQQTLKDFVADRGGLVVLEWATKAQRLYNTFGTMQDLLLYDPMQFNEQSGEQWFTKQGFHPITSMLPDSFYSPLHHYGNSGGLTAGSVPVLTGTWQQHTVAVKQYGQGRVVQFGIDAASLASMCRCDTAMLRLLLQSVGWAGAGAEKNAVNASITLVNDGYAHFDGEVHSSTAFFTAADLLQLAPGESDTINYDLDISLVVPGTYTLDVSAVNGGTVLQHARDSFTIKGAAMSLTALPESTSFVPGQVVTLSCGITNSGTAESQAAIGMRFMELLDDIRTVWIAPNSEHHESFSFQIPDDYPDGVYNAGITLNDTIVKIPCTVSAVQCSVSASLDKPFYCYGDTALLHLDITSLSDWYPQVYAAAASNGDHDRADFTLAPQQEIDLRIPVHENTLNSIAYGIYMASGRALYLNTIYIRIVKDSVTLYTDRSCYDPLDTVTVMVVTGQSGDLQVISSTGYEAVIPVSGSTSFSFTLPDHMAAGTHAVEYQLGEYSGRCTFDVSGYILKVQNLQLNKHVYDPVDQLAAMFTVQSNAALSVIVKGWLNSPEGVSTELFESIQDLDAGENNFTANAPIAASIAGTHTLVYGIYSSYTNNALVTGAKGFDVKPAGIVSVSTNKQLYHDTDEVVCTVEAFSCAGFVGAVDMVHGGEVIWSEGVSLYGSESVTIILGPLAPGTYTLDAQLRYASGIISEKPFTFTVKDMSPPAAPAGLSVVLEGSHAHFRWTPNDEPDLRGYNCYGNGVKLNLLPLTIAEFRSGSIVANGPISYMVTAVDSSSNESQASEPVIIQVDNIAPVITMTPHRSVFSTQPVQLTYAVTDDIDTAPSVAATYPSPTLFYETGTYQVQICAADAHGNKTYKAVTIVIDRSPPVPDCAELAVLHGLCEVTVTSVPTATDEHCGRVYGTTSDPLYYSAQGIYTITWHYQDTSGNDTTQTQTVIVQDTIAPQPVNDTLPILIGEDMVTVSDTPAAVDNCSGLIYATTADPLVYTAQGIDTITWQYQDENGNFSTQHQQVIIKFSPDMVVFAQEDLYLGYKVKVRNGSVKSNEYVLADGRDTIHGDILSAGTARLEYQSLIQGDVFTAGCAYVDADVVIDGVRKSGVNVPAETIGTQTVPVGYYDVYVPPWYTYTLSPGYYYDVFVDEGATLILQEGVYYFKSLIGYYNARLKCDIAADDSIQVNVRDYLEFYDYVRMSLIGDQQDPRSVHIYSNQPWYYLLDIGYQCRLIGRFTAPYAEMRMQQCSTLTGAIRARWVSLMPYVTIDGK